MAHSRLTNDAKMTNCAFRRRCVRCWTTARRRRRPICGRSAASSIRCSQAVEQLEEPDCTSIAARRSFNRAFSQSPIAQALLSSGRSQCRRHLGFQSLFVTTRCTRLPCLLSLLYAKYRSATTFHSIARPLAAPDHTDTPTPTHVHSQADASTHAHARAREPSVGHRARAQCLRARSRRSAGCDQSFVAVGARARRTRQPSLLGRGGVPHLQANPDARSRLPRVLPRGAHLDAICRTTL
eukprot:4826643-Pleurochrysis_carterae.AAC.2